MLWIVALGSAVGGAARYLAGTAAARVFGTAFPIGTLLINLSGSLAIGVLMRWSFHGGHSPAIRAFLTIGVCGGYTTFSALTFETIALAQDGAWGKAVGYAGGSLLLGLLATGAGLALGDQLGLGGNG
ncbi:MAG: fluoride efflux transporter CrcB [Gemmatimonadetes bacterium]|nr:fluoride efflux transporter CrcB [Gemmatimonadota bacterium]